MTDAPWIVFAVLCWTALAAAGAGAIGLLVVGVLRVRQRFVRRGL